MFKIFKKYRRLKYGISEKKHGKIELGDVAFLERKNFHAYFKKIKIDPRKTVSALQSHSNRVAVVNQNSLTHSVVNVDALVCEHPDIFLTITVADCLPIYFFDPRLNKIALSHSGWRGSVKNIVFETVKAMRSNPKDLLVAVGPGIGACHFEIQSDVLKNFSSYPEFVIKKNKKIFVNLRKIILKQLRILGTPKENVEISKECTYCLPDRYFSYRRDKPKVTEAMVAYIGLTSRSRFSLGPDATTD